MLKSKVVNYYLGRVNLNYIKLIKNFWLKDLEYHLSPSASKMYFALMETSNRLGWKNPFRMANSTLVDIVRCSQNTIIKSRNRLIEIGLITYIKGNIENSGVYTLLENNGLGLNEGLNKGLNKELNNPLNDKLKEECDIHKTKQNEAKKRTSKTNEAKSSLLPLTKIVKIYNSICKDLTPFDIDNISLIETNLSERNEFFKNEKKWTDFFNRVHNSDFLNNRIPDKEFNCSLIWIIKKENFVKILAGNYDKNFSEEKEHEEPIYLPPRDRF